MKRSKHSLSHYKLLSLNQGSLVPIGMYEALPGDTIQQATSALLRAAPLVAPVMHPVHAKIHHWFVPYRLLWDSWEDFITGGPDGMDASAFPTVSIASPATGSLHDYLGVPTGTYTVEVSALPYRAYALIFNEWYRDQDLVPPIPFSKADGVDMTTNSELVQAAWEKDYFTSARPWEQKGESVTIPLGVSAQVVPNTRGYPEFDTAVGNVLTGLKAAAADQTVQVVVGGGTASEADYLQWSTGMTGGQAHTGLQADLASATLIGINELREGFALQRYNEARARYGSRYSEYLRYLGVRSSDARLQRPEYLGGGKQTIQFSEVLQTAEGTDPVGTMRGHGIGAMRSNRYRRFFEEHGVVMSFMVIRPRSIYMQALSRMWLRRTKEDFWQKELEHIGQQEITNKEIYAMSADPDGVFGYQDRYDEYRRMESSVSGEFRNILNYWHMARDFATPPVLNASFVQAAPTDRIYAATNNDQIYAMCMHSIQARRMLSQTGTSFIF